VCTWTASRGLLEWLVWKRVRALAGLVVREQTRVIGLAGDRDRVTGAVVEAAAGGRETLTADLVVDATGRRSCIADWLEEIGLERPEETTVDGHMGYATRWYRATDGTDWKALLVRNIEPTPTRAGLVCAVEDGKWVVTLAGLAGDLPPTDEEGFIAFARSLASPRLHEAIEQAEPLGPVYGFRQMQNRRRHVERMRRWPAALLVAGDALSSFNPFYAQGITVAALEARALAAGAKPGLSAAATRRLQREIANEVKVPWLFAISEDFRSIPGGAGIGLRLAHRYLDAVVAAAGAHREVQRCYVEVIHLLRSPLTFLAPQALGRIIAGVFAPASKAPAQLPPPS
jgi:2-polyprenyl-6-methoxyphenol hydroxylase-like FAD-dependent oxidoreductase